MAVLITVRDKDTLVTTRIQLMCLVHLKEVMVGLIALPKFDKVCFSYVENDKIPAHRSEEEQNRAREILGEIRNMMD